MAQWKEIAIHITAWVLLLVFASPEVIRQFNAGLVPFGRLLITLLCLVLLFYYCYTLAWPAFNLPMGRWRMVALLAMAPVLFWGAVYGLYRLLCLAAHETPEYDTFGKVVNALQFKPPVVMIISGIAWGLKEVGRRTRENRQLKKLNEHVEMDYLRTQFNPHFLFNMLSNLYYSAYEVSEELAAHVKRIADLMAYAIRVNEDGKVELDVEVDHIRNYAELFRMRFEPKFHVNVEVSGDTNGLRIAPLLLIPFVENAFKHGVVANPGNPVSIRLKVQDNKLCYTVENAIGKHVKDPTRGVGLPAIRRRLQLIYPNRHSLEITDRSGRYSAHLCINL